MGDKVVIDFSLAFDWLRGWRVYSEPITERSKAKPKQNHSNLGLLSTLKRKLLCEDEKFRASLEDI